MPGGDTWNIGNYYIETIGRLEGPACDSCPQNSGGPNDVYISTDAEVDVYEIQLDSIHGQYPRGWGTGHATNGGWASYFPHNTAVPSTYSPLDYHKYSALHTSDGKTDSRVCMYLDDTLVGTPGCSTYVPGNFNSRGNVLVSAGSNSGNATSDITMDVQYIRVWSCDAYKTDMCNGSALVRRPGPASGQTLTYYH
jgi:hypothetical protein